MTLVLALLLTAPCTLPDGAQVEGPERTQTACALLAQPAAAEAPVDRDALRVLLEEDEFSRARNRNSSVTAILWARFVAWFMAFLQTKAAAGFAHVAPYVVLAIATALVLIGVLRSRSAKGRQRSRPAAARSESLQLDPPEQHLARARALVASAPREAIREGSLALLSSLEQRRFARPERVKTNREVCAELPGRGAPQELVREVSARLDWYDRAFYSLAAVEPSAAGAFLDGVQALAERRP